MTLDRFVAERAPAWDELEALLRRAGRRPERLGPDALLRLGSAYRAAVADLAFARRRFPGDPVTERLEALVLRGRQAVYREPGARGSLRAFAVDGYWRRVAERPWPLLASVLLLFGPMALAAAWGLDDPAAAAGVIPAEFQGAAEPGDPASRRIGPDQSAAFAGEILTNNIQVSFLAFAGGILLGLGTAAALVFNGGFIGAIVGVAIGAGSAETLLRLILPHGVLELSIICVAGAAGLRMGWSIVEPGTLTRGASLRREARRSVEIVLGTMPWFVLAGVVEGFVTPQALPLPAAVAVGSALGVVYWGLVLWRGVLRPPRSP